jgi:hypothetical protein
VISKLNSRKASAHGGTYQDDVTAPVSRNYNHSGIVEYEELDDEEMADEDLMNDAAPKAVAINKVLSPQLYEIQVSDCSFDDSCIGSYMPSDRVLSYAKHGSGMQHFIGSQKQMT